MKDILLQKIANTLLVNIQNIDNWGLFNGRMGVAVFLYHYARHSGISIYSDVADDLMDSISNSLSSVGAVDFETGLTGIGWGIQHLLDNKFVEGDADDILSEVDEYVFKNISKENLLPFSSKNHLFGHGLYFLSREKNRVLSKEKAKILKKVLNIIDDILECDNSHLSIKFLNSILFFIELSTDKKYAKQKQDIVEKVRNRISAIKLNHTEKVHTSLEDYSKLLWQNILYFDTQTHFDKENFNLMKSMVEETFEDFGKLSVVGLNLLLY